MSSASLAHFVISEGYGAPSASYMTFRCLSALRFPLNSNKKHIALLAVSASLNWADPSGAR